MVNKNIDNKIIEPDNELFYSRNDKNDPRMGEFVFRDREYYPKADYVIVGCPQDMGVKRNNGREGAKGGPISIRRALYKFPVPEPMRNKVILDIGDVRVADTLEGTHKLLYTVVYNLLENEKRLIVLGGGNDISYPDCRALSELSGELLVFNIDSHFDVRDDEQSTSGTPYRQLLEGEFIQPPKFYELANKQIVNSPEYQYYLKKKGVNVASLEHLRGRGIDSYLKTVLHHNEADSIFWGFDLDAVRADDAPGVSAPYPIGLTAEEICAIAEIAGSDKRSRILEITELNPEYDVDNRTAKLAAMIIMYYLNN